MARPRSLTLVALAGLLAATTLAAAPPDDPGPPDGVPPKGPLAEEPAEDTVEPRSVVAVIDSAANPFHEWFQAGGPIYGGDEPDAVTQDVLAELGIDDDHIIDVEGGDPTEAREQFQDEIEPGELYWFEGTNVMGISFDEDGEVPILPDDSGDTHGVGTTGAVTAASPESIVILVEGINTDSETWAFTTPGVDAISTSYGFPGSPPLPFHLENSHTGVVEEGKQHFGAADNSPGASPVDSTSGPWWTIGIAGFHEGSSEGRENLSGSLPDFVGDFTQDLPYCHDCTSGTESVSGTSFATPRSAGTFSEVLLAARRDAGHVGGIVTEDVDRPLMVDGDDLELTNWELRRALEEGAYYPSTDDYDASSAITNDFAAAPVNDAAPWAQVAWGAITPDEDHEVVSQTLAHAGVGDEEPTRTKSAEACAFMTLNIQARHAYWDNVAVGSESFGSDDEDPYEYC